jgi:uncharacterized protein
MFDLAISADTMLLSALIFAAALLYSSVGHAGASGYIAAMALFSTAPAVMKPTALVLNILVAALGTIRWHGMGLVNRQALTPLLLASVPFAFLGGAIQLPVTWYRLVIGVILIVAAATFLFKPQQEPTDRSAHVPILGGVLSGGTVGFLSGLTGTGGGIFLSPILLLMRWADNPRQASGITAPFILINSIAALMGNLVVLRSLPAELPLLASAAFAGGLVGTSLGTSWASSTLLQRLLGLVLLIAGVKFIWL